MKPQEINWNEWEEISREEFEKIAGVDGNCLDIRIYDNAQKLHLFKKKEVFPKVFENDSYTFTVKESGEMIINERLIKRTFFFDESLPLLIEAVECAKKQMEKNRSKWRKTNE